MEFDILLESSVKLDVFKFVIVPVIDINLSDEIEFFTTKLFPIPQPPAITTDPTDGSDTLESVVPVTNKLDEVEFITELFVQEISVEETVEAEILVDVRKFTFPFVEVNVVIFPFVEVNVAIFPLVEERALVIKLFTIPVEEDMVINVPVPPVKLEIKE